MNRSGRLILGAVVALTAFAALPVPPADADGAASTRNIIFGAAAAGAGAFVLINHNAKVHQKYAEYDHRQAQTQAAADNAHAAYESERQAYAHEAALASAYAHEAAHQHAQLKSADARIAQLERSMRTTQGAMPASNAAFVERRPVFGSTGGMVGVRPATTVAYGWGSY